MGSVIDKRDDVRFRFWQAGLAALVAATALGLIHSGATWGATSYDPASDPYSLQNITPGDGVQAWWNAGTTGKGVDVALIDTGVASVPALSGAGKIVNGPDLSSESQNPALQHVDTNGHGTFMAGIIGGNDGLPGGYRGVAPDSRILSVKVAPADGSVDVRQVIAAIDWVVQHRHDNGLDVRVINLSFGTDSTQPYQRDPLAQAAENAWKKGIVVVAAAGNGGFGAGLTDPAYDPTLIAAGAADTMGTASIADDQPAPFTAGAARCVPGDCVTPTLLAPGTHMQGLRVPGSYIDQNYPTAALGSLYFRGSGTSEAAAYVTGAVALLFQRYPKLTPDEVKQMLASGAQPLSGVSSLVQGSGELYLDSSLTGPAHGGAAGRGPGGDHGSAGPGGWSGSTWSGSTWSGSSWSASTWSNEGWLGATWGRRS